MRRLMPLLLLLFGLFQGAPALAEVSRDPYAYFFNETWNNLHEELQRARDEGKQAILIFFEMDECPFCHRMKRSVLNQPTVQAYFRQHFINIPVDIEGDVEMVDFQGQPTTQKDFAFKANRVRATPVIAIYDLEGNEIVRYTGATANAEEFLWLGQFVVEGRYKTMRFTKYKRQRAREARRQQ